MPIFIPTIRKQQFPAFKNQMLEYIQEKLNQIYGKIQKYDKKNNIENLNKLENDKPRPVSWKPETTKSMG